MTTTDVLTRGVENVIPDREKLKKLLDSGKKLNVYLGIDPTATRIHIGHAVPLRKLQAFCELGHNVSFLIGDFTALIGDTSDKDSERPVLTSEQIGTNFETYKKQAEKILDFSKIKVLFNSEWLQKLTFTDIVKLCQHFSAGDFVGRELIKKRLAEGKKVGLHELLYPVMQGYDSYHLDTDIQLGGTDQTFNMQAGRILQKDLRDKESFIIANGFLEGTDGRKMSKSWGNAIWLTDGPEEMFGKVMSLKDELIVNYFKLATKIPLADIKEMELRLQEGENPIKLKKQLAHQIVEELHGKVDADAAEDNFEKTVQNKELPKEIPTVHVGKTNHTMLAMVTLARPEMSKGAARRLIEQGGVTLDGNKHFNPIDEVEIHEGSVIKIGKREYFRIKL